MGIERRGQWAPIIRAHVVEPRQPLGVWVSVRYLVRVRAMKKY